MVEIGQEVVVNVEATRPGGDGVIWWTQVLVPPVVDVEIWFSNDRYELGVHPTNGRPVIGLNILKRVADSNQNTGIYARWELVKETE